MGGQAENQQIMTLVRIENEVMREKLGMLFNAMAVLGDTKNIQDQFAAEKIRLDEEVAQIKKGILELETSKVETEQKFSESLMIIQDLTHKAEVSQQANAKTIRKLNEKLSALEIDRDKIVTTKKEFSESFTKAQRKIDQLT